MQEENSSTAAMDLADQLPLRLIQSEIIPPAPTRPSSALDYLPDLAGNSWIAYGASNLLVISHFPSPSLSPQQTLTSPILRQVFELSPDNGSATVSAISWSPSGDLAAALDNSVRLFSHNSVESSHCSFSWGQTAVLVQSTNIETIAWTDSGDGIISGGVEVVLWRLKNRSWEIAWKFKPELPQNLVAATFSIQGPLATAHVSTLYTRESLSSVNEASKNVLLCYRDGNSSYVESELHHPMPVCMIQWRPLMRRQRKQEYSQSVRQVLLSCCLDGTVRLWCEINDAKVKRVGKDIHDRKSTGRYYHVATIEINQTLKGTLGSDVFVKWATDIDGMISACKTTEKNFPSVSCNRPERAGNSAWLIAVGPNTLVTMWAIHCLDDVSPLRFPRVTLWLRQELADNKSEIQASLLNKVCILRSELCEPPNFCSLVRLLPCNSLVRSQLYAPLSASEKNEGPINETGKDNSLSGYAGRILNVDGHTGKILQVAVHRYRLDINFAASLDTDGLVFLWSFPTDCHGLVGMPTIYPTRKLSKKILAQFSHLKYTSMVWAPSFSEEDTILLMGHDQGIDCILIKIRRNEEENLLCHKLCTIAFPSYSSRKGSTNLYSIPMPSNYKESFRFNNFLLLLIWDKGFQALSWKISIHSTVLDKHFQDSSHDSVNAVGNSSCEFESDFVGMRYYIAIDSCSTLIPDPHKDEVTSFSAVSPNISVLSENLNLDSINELQCDYSGYHMITGYNNGNVKLWRSTSNLSSEWELVGMLATHLGPITSISLSDCGRKISTLCSRGSPNNSSTVHIWECVPIGGLGTFILEDALVFDGEVVALNWLTLGSGQLILGVCLQNELRVYAERRSGSQHLMRKANSFGGDIWFCISFAQTYSAICGFVWGPGAMAVILCDRYFSIFSQWSFLAGGQTPSKGYLEIREDNFVSYRDGSNGCIQSEIFIGNDDCCSKGSSGKQSGQESQLPMKLNSTSDALSTIFLASTSLKHDLTTKTAFYSVQDIVEKLHGTLADYHPTALLTNINSGHWKRAYVSLSHLVDYFSSSSFSIKNRTTISAHVIPLVHLSNYVEGVLSTERNESGESASFAASSLRLNGGANQFAFSWGPDASSNTSTSAEFKLSSYISAVEMLHEKAAISDIEKVQILIILDLLKEIRNPTSAYEGLDEPGRRFWVAVRFQQLCLSGRYGCSASFSDMVFGSEQFAWAFHSDCQENLFGSLLPQEPSWEEIRNVGVGFWFTNTSQLRIKMEKLARQQYLKSKDPKACALLYIALNRLQVLAGLFKLSKDEKDKPLVAFLSRDFKEDKNKAAALKNAYVLMGRHQLELAAAFFLLGGDTSSTVTVCAKNLGDEQLALVICRLVEGYSGPLERQLISKHLLPSAIEKGDSWRASFLEWILGNYAQSFVSILGVELLTPGNTSVPSPNQASLLDPSIGQYCLMLATKNTLKNAVGEYNAAALGRWAIWICATALDRCGLPVEALECLSSSLGAFGGSDQGRISDNGKLEVPDFLVPSLNNSSCNWISGDVALCMETRAKIGLAMKYISKLICEYPGWPDSNMASVGIRRQSEHELEQYRILLANFQGKLVAGLSCLEQKFNLSPLNLINMIACALSSNGLWFIGYHILHDYASQSFSLKKEASDSSFFYSFNSKLLSRATEEVSCSFSRFIVTCSMTCSQPNSWFNNHDIATENRSKWLAVWKFYVRGLRWSIWRLRTIINLFSGTHTEEFIRISSSIFDLCEFCIYFGLSWLQRNFRSLVLIMKSTHTYANGHAADGNDVLDLSKLLHSIENLLADDALADNTENAVGLTGNAAHDQARTLIPTDVKWKIVWVASWRNISCFLKQQLKLVYGELDDNYSFGSFDKLSFSIPGSDLTEPDGNDMNKQLKLVPVVLAKLLRSTCAQISSSCMKQFAAFLVQNMEDEFKACILTWLEGSILSHSSPYQGLDKQEAMSTEDNSSASEMMWDLLSDSKLIRDGLSEEDFQWQLYIKPKPFKEWGEVQMTLAEEREVVNGVSEHSSNLASNETGSPVRGSLSPYRRSFASSTQPKQMLTENFMAFQNPKVVHRIDGELLEALCVNSIGQKQAALASNRKGIIYFNWDNELPPGDYCNYIWAEAEWPQKGWAGSESTPVPTCVSPGIGLGSKKGKHVGLGGATIGSNPFVRPGKDGIAFGVPGYAGMGASGLGWEIQEDFEEFVDPPATVNNISTRAFSSHPSRPFFLAGSSNTHVYLWEFGKDKAMATYGVLPAANVPPPYALASISSVQFDKCGQRFATAALDGSLCTWQLEVGGRSNICPIESCICFNNHASDATYVTASGSIIAAAGHSSSGINVVIWDTLAPPSTSRASIMCHEGGAHSLSVFDNDIGSGSISPFIVTGGKGGDVGLHDFRYIATGRTKKHKLFTTSGESDGNASFIADVDSRNGDRNRDGMLWYIPKAHSGSVTKICTIPNSSLFLTGSKDGDVKLWDAKTAKLVSHWPKLHEKHTFLQPSSRGFREVVRAAVTDIQVVSRGFLSCGGDGSVKLVQLKGSE